MNITLSKSQEIFLNAKTRGRIFLGGVGAGKTLILCLLAILEALKSRNVAIVSFSYRSLRDVIATTLIKTCVDNNIPFVFNKSEMVFYVYNTKPILLRSNDNPESLRGLNLHSFLIDECSSSNRATFDILLGRLRSSKDAFWALVGTPRGKDFVYNLLESEGLTNVYKDGFSANSNVTVVTQKTTTSPFLPDEYVQDLLKQYTSSFAAQELDCQIIDMSNGLFKKEWFKEINAIQAVRGVRSYDLAVSTKTASDFTVGLLMTKNNGIYTIHDMIRVKQAYPDLKETIIKTAYKDGIGIAIILEDSGQQQAIIQDLRRDPRLHSHTIRTYKPTRDKYSRALPVASQAELGNINIDRASWNRAFYDELTSFTGSQSGHDDICDALSQAYHMINVGPTQVSSMG
jgi:predicted phage terminase large subunit-like protein